VDKKTFADEAILKKREELSREPIGVPEDGIYLGGQLLSFERQEIMKGYSILLPSIFSELSEEHAMIKYPSSNRPDIIFTTFDETVNLGFTAFAGNSQIVDVLQTTHQVRESMMEAKDAGVVLAGSCTMLEEVKGSWFDFRTNAIDGAIYNMLLIMVVDNVALQASFNCLLKNAGEWKPVVLELWKSIERMTK
jgi:hypothetical protein